MSRAHLRELLHALSAAFQSKDVEALLRLFSTDPAVTYAGSEFNEKATGPAEVRALLSELLGRPATYSFDFGDLTFSEHHGLVWLLADGQGTETRQDGTRHKGSPVRTGGQDCSAVARRSKAVRMPGQITARLEPGEVEVWVVAVDCGERYERLLRGTEAYQVAEGIVAEELCDECAGGRALA